MIVDAIVLAGGRSSRLDSVPKSELYLGGETLLQRTLSAARIARCTVVVGPVPAGSLPDGVLATLENPPFGGPAAGIAAGMTSLAAHAAEPSDAVLVIACDMPHVDRVIPVILAQLLAHPHTDGVIPTDAQGHQQPLAAAYRTAALAAAVAAHERSGPLSGLSVSRLVESLKLAPMEVPDQATDDVDTWDDTQRLGVSTHPIRHASPTEEPHE